MLKLLLLTIATLWFLKCFMAIDAWGTLHHNVLFLSPGKIVHKEEIPGASVLSRVLRERQAEATQQSWQGDPQSLAAQKSLNWSQTFGILPDILHPSRIRAGSLATQLLSCPPTQHYSPFFLHRLLRSYPDGLILKVSGKLPHPSLNCPPKGNSHCSWHLTFTYSFHSL